MKKTFDLTGKVAIVTGSTSGIGIGIARVLARQGAQVVVTGRRVERGEAVAEEIRAEGCSAAFHKLDITDEASVKALTEDTVREYGKLDILWFDFSYENENYCMRGEAWRASELVDMVRSLQPGVVIDNRLEVSGEGFGSLWECDPTPYHGDFVSPEQIIPPNGIQDKQGRDMVWEACVTMNNNWGYCANDHYFKPAPMLIKKLVECVSKGGNLLLNVGPDARGNIPPQSLEILRQIGAWMKDNSQSIYGCGKAGLEKPDNGRITRRGNKLYYHLFENTIGPMPLPGVKAEEVEYVRYLATGAEVPISNSWTHSNFPDIVFADLGPDPILPDPVDTVLEVTLKE